MEKITFANSASLDSFSRLRVSNTETLFSQQFTYNLSPLVYEQITAETGAAITHDATNRMAGLAFSSTPTGGKAIMQSYEHIRYQPGRSHLIFITFNFIEGATDVLKFAGYSDGNNGIEFQLNGTTPQITLYSTSTTGDQTVAQTSWNIDTLTGKGVSGKTLDITKTQILVIDMQALYVGRVRVGFDIDGVIVPVHEFKHANLIVNPYIATASLPIRCGMTCTGTVSTTMKFICSSVATEGGTGRPFGQQFTAEGTGTAASGARAHILSVRPNTTFNSIANRIGFILDNLSFINEGANPVKWELVIGQAITGTTTFTDVNATYSAYEYNTAGTISGSPSLVIASGFAGTGGVQSDLSVSAQVSQKYPITLNAAGAVRALGTLSVIATGIGGTSAVRAILNWTEEK